METQSGARSPLVDPFGRELEEWLRDAPATRTPYVADLVVPPVTGPVQRPDLTGVDSAGSETDESDAADATATVAAIASDDTAFRRPRDRGRHASVCAPSFPEPPERLALRIDELALEVSAQSGRPVLERIVVLEDEIRRRDEDLARLTAWEADVADVADPEVDAARAYARTVFADLLADAADEADRRDRAARRRAVATGALATVTAPTTVVVPTAAPALVPVELVQPTAAPVAPDRIEDLDVESARGDEPARPVLRLPAVSPVSANTRPTPLVQPVTGPTVVDRDAFAAVLRAHVPATDGTPVVFPEEQAAELPTVVTTEAALRADVAETDRPSGWWARTVAAVLRLFRR
ncbi:hypothetical protein [Curtobacterium sp. 9128]|uniref:hypothetical protein n=1 Tax=Curtobacterium sp. 9128 TaxID=1793722 RepID=UPI0011AA8B86|nr:hypothetical protein [Curtobacterium sp. 9128]